MIRCFPFNPNLGPVCALICFAEVSCLLPPIESRISTLHVNNLDRVLSMKSRMSPMGDPSNPIYHLQPGRTQNLEQNLTPHSAVCSSAQYFDSWKPVECTTTELYQVSSFNLPAAYDSSLITPVSMTSSPNIAARSAPASRRDLDSNLSPLISPTSYQLGWDPESYGPAYGQPMKHKDRSVALQLSTVDQVFPPSPSYMVAPNHYFGHYTVSAPLSARTSNSSPSVQQSPHLQNSPNMQSAGGLSNSSYHSMHSSSQNGSMFRQSNPAPILIAPNPNSLRAATVKQDYGTSRQDSMSCNRSPPSSYGPIQRTFPEPLASLPSRGKKSHKRKDPPSPYYDEIASFGDLNDGERLLLQLTTRDHLQWKEVAQKWNKAMNLDKSVAALQMRKKRLQERLRVRSYLFYPSEVCLIYASSGVDRRRGSLFHPSSTECDCIKARANLSVE